MYRYYNPNPDGNNVGDCTIRAICKATGEDWDTVFAALTAQAFYMKNMPSANHVWGSYLRRKGFERRIVDDKGRDIYTVADFADDHNKGTYILAVPEHVVCVQNGNYYDTWDSGREIPVYYWRKYGTSGEVE